MDETGSEDLTQYCLAKPGAWPDEQWDGDTVAKVGDKIFAFLGGDAVGLSCGAGREEADEWVARYPHDARASPYIGRFGWNVMTVGGAIPRDELLEAVDSSYEAVGASGPRDTPRSAAARSAPARGSAP